MQHLPRRLSFERRRCVRFTSSPATILRDANQKIKSFNDIPKIQLNPTKHLIKTIMKTFVKHKPNYLRTNYFEKINKKYGPIVCTGKLGSNSKMVHIFDPKDVATVFTSEDKYPQKKMFPSLRKARKINQFLFLKQKFHSNMGPALLNGKAWHDIRSKFQQETLKLENVESYYPVFDKIAIEFVNLIPSLANQNGEINTLLDHLHYWSIDNIGMFLFGQILGGLKSLTNKNNSDKTIETLLHVITSSFDLIYKLELGFHWYKWWITPMLWKLSKTQRILSK